MRVFLTGATGFIGSAITRELLGAGHQVVGLARSDERAVELVDAGADALRGGLFDLDSLSVGARDSDGVIHTAFGRDFSNYQEACETHRSVVEARSVVAFRPRRRRPGLRARAD